jgi:hypothetical protein
MDNEAYENELGADNFWPYVEDPTGPAPEHSTQQSAVYRQQAQSLIQLKNLLYRSTCPTAHELGDYYLGQLSRSQSQMVQQHLFRCPHCAHDLVMYREFMAELKPSPSLLEQLKMVLAHLWRSVVGTTETWQPAWATRGEMEKDSAVYFIALASHKPLQLQ